MRFKDHESLIFSEELLKLISENPEELEKEYRILNVLRHYAISNLFIIDNKVLKEIIPELQIKLKELKIQTSKSGEEEVLVELISCKGDIEIPIRYESDGIKKIVAVLHLLIAMFNYNSMSVLIDELDSGIFEYLLGEILEIIEEIGKGQLVFTTTNPENRYIQLKNVKTNNNLRDMYYRDLILGGQNEVIYDRTNSAQIARAFRTCTA